MIPIEFPEYNMKIAEGQDQYQTLPVYFKEGPEGETIHCWKLSWRERVKLLITGKLWFSTLTFNQPMQPILPVVDKEMLLSLKQIRK